MNNCKFCNSIEITLNNPRTHYKCGTTDYDGKDSVQSPLCMVLQERRRQDLKWGEQNHAMEWWLAILMEEVGEFSEAVLETHFGGDKGGYDNMLKEAIHSAAVGLSIVECLVRRNHEKH